MSKYKVTVVIPCYNAEKTIQRAIESVPIRDDVEIIVVDDGSTDNSTMIADSALLPRVFILQQAHKGVAAAVNMGIDYAEGEYIVLLGADDWFYTHEFEKAMEYLDGKVDLAYFNLEITSGEIWRTNEETKRALCGSVKFMRKDFIADTRNNESLQFAEDRDFYFRLLEKNPTEVFTDLIVKHYVWPQENSLSGRHMKGEI